MTSLAVVTNIFLAQSGLPVFGQGFRLNVKDVLGMMFIERGSGSTCELLLDKIVKILKEIKHVHNSKVVLVLDEVGIQELKKWTVINWAKMSCLS